MVTTIPSGVLYGPELLWQDEFADAVEQLQTDYPEAYSGSAIDDDVVWVSFTGAPPPGALEILSTLPGSVEVRPGAGWSASDIRALCESIHYSVLGQPGVVDTTTSIDTNRGTIHVQAQVAVDARGQATGMIVRDAVRTSKASAVNRAISDLSDIVVTVEIPERSLSSGDSLYGGSR